MTPEQWQRMEELFERGQDAGETERARLLHECADDPKIQTQLEALWEHAEAAPSFLRAPALAAFVGTHAQLVPDQVVAGRFTVLELIGAGGMGEVYRARDERLRRIVALKVLPSRLSADAEYRKRLEQEAHAVSSLSHPRICSLHDLGSDGNLLYLVMEYVPGETLEARLRSGPLPREDAVRIALEICEGLRHAHENGLVHRDLKPANVMLSARGVKLLDFGIAARAGSLDRGTGRAADSTSALTAADQIVGTIAYMSPEQAAGRQVDARSDIYSFGVLFLEMLTGQRAFPGGPDSNSIGVNGNQRLPAEMKFPAALESILLRCLQRAPEARFASAAELDDALRTRARPRVVGKRRVAAGATAVLCAAAAVLWYASAARSKTGEPRMTVLTAYTGIEYHPTLSPDGRSVAFLWNGDESNFDVYVQAIGSAAPLRLTTDPLPEKWPQWSPDGRWIAFGRGPTIYLIPPSGGAERAVAQMHRANGIGGDGLFAWSADSSHILFPGTADPAAIEALNISTGTVRRLTAPEASSEGHWSPTVSPDGRRLLYVRRTKGKNRTHVLTLGEGLVVDADREVPWVNSNSVTWAADSREVIFARPTPAASFLFRSSVDTQEEGRQLPYGEEGMYPAVSRVMNRLVYMRRDLDLDIWTVAAGGGEATKRIASSRADTDPEYSPDGTRIAFLSNRSGRRELWVAGADGSKPQRLATTDSVRVSWRPDGQRIAYSDEGDVRTIGAGGGTPDVVVADPSRDTSPAYSRDGRWLYFVSDRSGVEEIWRIGVSGGQALQITQGGAIAGVESYEGRHLYFLRRRDRSTFLHVMPVEGGAAEEIAEVIHGRVSLAVTERGLYFIRGGVWDAWGAISLYDPATRAVRDVVRLPKRQRMVGSGLSVSPDGAQFAVSFYELEADLMLVENFR